MTVKQWVNHLGPIGLENQDLGGAVKEKLAGLEGWPPRGQGWSWGGEFSEQPGYLLSPILNIQIDIHFNPFRSVCLWQNIPGGCPEDLGSREGKWWETGVASGAPVKKFMYQLMQLRRKRIRRDLHRTQWKVSTTDKGSSHPDHCVLFFSCLFAYLILDIIYWPPTTKYWELALSAHHSTLCYT